MADSPDRPVTDHDPPLPRWLRRSLIAGLSLLTAAAILCTEPLQSANDRSRWCTVWSLVERGSYRIDEIESKTVLHKPSGKRRRLWSTIDKVYHEQHFYSSKPPLFPTLVAGLYAVTKAVTGWTLLDDTAAVTHLVLLAINWLPWTVALVVLARMLDRYARRRRTRVFLLLTAGAGTLLLPFLVTLNNHTVAATAVVFTVAAALKVLVEGDHRTRYFLVAGLFAGWTAANELPAALWVVLLAVALFRANRRATLVAFVPAVLAWGVAFLGTNVIATGGLKPFYAYYGTEKYEYTIDGKDSHWKKLKNNPTGIDAGGDSTPAYLLHCTVGHHGLLSLSPVFLLTLLAWFRLRRPSAERLRTLSIATAVITVVVLGFYLTRTSNYNYGGVSCGLRWMLWLVPLWLVAMIPVLDDLAASRPARIATILLLLFSTISSVTPLVRQGNWNKHAAPNPWQQPWLFQLMELEWKWIDYYPQAAARRDLDQSAV